MARCRAISARRSISPTRGARAPTGSLEADRIDILERWDIPVAIERVRLDVAGDAVRIHEGAFVVAGEQLALTGTVTRQPKTFGLDLRATADAIDAERLLRAFPRGEARPRDAAGWNLPVDGRIAVDAKSVAYGRYVVRPLSGTVTLAPERIVADVKEARLCDLALPLRAVLVPGSASVTGKIAARGQPVAGAVVCLTGARLALTGTFDLDADARRERTGRRSGARRARHVPLYRSRRRDPEGAGHRAHPVARRGRARCCAPGRRS